MSKSLRFDYTISLKQGIKNIIKPTMAIPIGRIYETYQFNLKQM
jgi:hypothetical protein